MLNRIIAVAELRLDRRGLGSGDQRRAGSGEAQHISLLPPTETALENEGQSGM